MTAAALQPAQILPMSPSRRFGIATASSLTFHAIVVILIGLFASRGAVSVQEVLIPIEVTVEKPTEPPAPKVVLGGGGHPQGPAKRSDAPALLERPTRRPPSSAGGRPKAAPAPPRILTSKKGKEPSGPIGQGREPAGPGGREEVPAGPTYGPAIVGGPAPIYPKHALDRGLEGTVSLAVTVRADGSVQSVSVAKSSGHALLDEAAVRAVEQGWTFKSGVAKGKPASGKVTVIFVFSGASVKRG